MLTRARTVAVNVLRIVLLITVAWALLAIRLPMKVANEFVHLWKPGIPEGLK